MSDCIDALRDLFDTVGITDNSTKFLLYTHAMAAEYVFSNDGHYDSYYDAWNSNHATVYKKYLADLEPELLQDQLDSFCELVKHSDGLDFFNGITPDLFTGNLEALFSFFGASRDRRSLVYAVIKLWVLFEYKNYLNSRDYPIYQLSKQEIFASIRTSYQAWDKYTLVRNLYNFEEHLGELWITAFGVPFIPQPIKSTGIAGVRKKILESGLSDDDILQLFYICKVAQTFSNLKSIGDPFSYFRRVFLEPINGETEIADGGEITSPAEDFFLSQELFNEALAKWKSLDAVNFVRSLLFSGYSNNICTENGITMSHLFRYAASKYLMVVDANPDFIVNMVESKLFDVRRILFVHNSKDLAMVYLQRFPDCNFAFVGYLDGAVQIAYLKRNTDYPGREPRYISDRVQQIFDASIVFARKESEKKLGALMNGLTENLVPGAAVYFLCPNSLLDTRGRSIRLHLAKKYDYDWVQILPTETSSAWLKKNVLCCLREKKAGYSGPVKLFNSEIYKSDIGGIDVVCRDPWSICVPQNEFIESEKTINRLWEQFRPKPQKGPSRTTRKWSFSTEITLWYSWTNGRGRIHVYESPTVTQLVKKNVPRGKKIKTIYFGAASIEKAEERFEQIVWEEPLYTVIVSDIEKNYKCRPMSLKTFWFCKERQLRGKEGYRKDIADRLFTSGQLCDLMSDQRYSSEVYRSIIDEDLSELNKKDKVNVWRTLNVIISLANQLGMFYPNPISDIVRAEVEKDRGYQAVRKNLAKRSYELEEEEKMLHLLEQNLPGKGEFVGAAISFYCGITNRQICALTWGDYKKLFRNEMSQLWINKTLADNSTIKHLDSSDKNMFRRVPVVKQLALILDEREKFVREHLGGAAVNFDDLTIVSKEDLVTYCDPAEIKYAKEQMEIAAGIEPMEVSITKAGAKVTDLNEYSGDRFRSNFYYRALQTCKMTRAEANYIYGVEPPITFAKHYCDYTNDFSQLVLCRKLERWTCLHQSKAEKAGISEKSVSANGRYIRVKPNLHYRSAIELRIDVQQQKEIDGSHEVVVSVSDDRGINLTVRKQEG